ncbi:MAG: YceD family protein [Leptospirales bacterium]
MLRFHIDSIPDLRLAEALPLDLSLSEEIAAAPAVFLSKEAAGDFARMDGRIEATLGREGTDVMVDLTVCYETPLICGRCLAEFVRRGETGERTMFFHQKDPEPDMLERYGSDGWVDLGPWLRELLLTDLPFYPLCDEECRGLCPKCGQNRNDSDCGHLSES